MSDSAAAYTHGHHPSVLRSHSWRTVANSAEYLRPHLRAGMTVLDIGCGPGTLTLDLAGHVTPGQVIGIDSAPEAVAIARRNAADAGDTSTGFRVGDVYRIDLPEASQHLVHAHQVLQHLSDPVAALREMRRVCRPGGLVAARDADFSAMTWYPQMPGLDRWLELYRRVARGNGGEPDAGRRMLGWARAAGFEEVTASASTWCFATVADRAWWGGLWADRVRDSQLAHQILADGLAGRAELAALAEDWHRWAAHPDGWFAVLHGEIVCRN